VVNTDKLKLLKAVFGQPAPKAKKATVKTKKPAKKPVAAKTQQSAANYWAESGGSWNNSL